MGPALQTKSRALGAVPSWSAPVLAGASPHFAPLPWQLRRHLFRSAPMSQPTGRRSGRCWSRSSALSSRRHPAGGLSPPAAGLRRCHGDGAGAGGGALSMKVVPLRLQPGDDLRLALEAWMDAQQEQAGYVITWRPPAHRTRRCQRRHERWPTRHRIADAHHRRAANPQLRSRLSGTRTAPRTPWRQSATSLPVRMCASRSRPGAAPPLSFAALPP